MKWRGRKGSDNIEDRRGAGRAVGSAGTGGLGVVGIIVLVVVAYVMGVDIRPFLSGDVGPVGTPEQRSADEDQAGKFVSVVLADTENVWAEVFRTQIGDRYRRPTLVLFSGSTRSPCGGASGATGPFYCPGDRKIYLDTNFFVTLRNRMHVDGDFAAAYVVAHEVAHHVQNELGLLGKANQTRARVNQAQSNQISVMIELQADCFAGIWSKYAEERLGVLEAGDIAEAMNAAKQVGDDTLARASGQRPMPHTFTHGTSAQRQRWFELGYKTADINRCNTFSADRL